MFYPPISINRLSFICIGNCADWEAHMQGCRTEERCVALLFGYFPEKNSSPACVSHGLADAHSANAESNIPE